MCGRYALFKSSSEIANRFAVSKIADLKPRYNVAPTQQVATISLDKESNNPAIKFRKWGLIPSWAKDSSMSAKLINARAETVAEKPSFRAAFKRRRCLIISDGFYEWQKQETKKQPYYINLQEGQTFAFAGLWESWQDSEGEAIESCTIITTAANELMASIHERMPVILPEENYNLWLDCESNNADKLQDILLPLAASQMKLKAVSTRVNNARYDRPDCLEEN